MKFRVHHVALSVDDLPASTRFYGELGFRAVREWRDPSGSPQIRHLELDGTLLELFWFRDRRAAPESAGELVTDLARIGTKHLALQVESIVAAKRFVQEKGWSDDPPIVQGNTGVTYFFIKDPSGILLEFVEEPPST